MHNRKAAKAFQLPQSNSLAWKQLALGSDGVPPGGRGRVAAAVPPRDPTLSEKFNTAASGITTRKQIEMLRRKQSQNRHTLEFTPFGSVNKVIDRTRDRLIQSRIDKLHMRLSKEKGLTQKFSRAQQQGKVTVRFNRASRGLSL